MKLKFLLILFVMLCFVITPIKSVYAEEEEKKKTEKEILEEEVNKQLEEFDFSDLETIIDDDVLKVTDEKSFKEIVNSLISGKQTADAVSIFNKVVKTLFSEIAEVIPIVLIIIAIAILGNIVSSFQSSTNSKTISDLTHFVCVAVVVVLIVAVVKNVYTSTTGCVNSMVDQMSILFPVLLTLLTAMGSVVSVGIYQPIVALLSGGVTSIFKSIIYPIFVLCLIFVILNNLSQEIKLNKFISFLGSAFKWIVGFVFTLFAGVLAIQGVSAGKYDTISLKATRFAMKSYVPIVGGYLSEGLDYILLSGLLIRNAIGVTGLLILIGTILIPIINVLILKLALHFAAGIIEPLGNSKIANLCEDLSKVLVYPIVVILAIAFMYILLVGLVMCTVSGV